MAKLKIDELNSLDRESAVMRSIPYEEYFGDMDLDDDEKQARIALAKSIEQVFIFLFVMISVEMSLNNDIDTEYYYDMTERRFLSALKENDIDVDGDTKEDKTDFRNQIREHCRKTSEEIVDSIVEDNNVKNKIDISDDRAMFIAENESNSIRNIVCLENAIKKGMKYKTWVTKMDSRVRHTHWLVNMEKIGIYDEFQVGICKMVAPKVFAEDSEEDAGEAVNCRCVLHYSKTR